jgi:hypothetical protein
MKAALDLSCVDGEDCLDRSIDKFVAEQNIIRLNRLVSSTTDEAERFILLSLSAVEMSNLANAKANFLRMKGPLEVLAEEQPKRAIAEIEEPMTDAYVIEINALRIASFLKRSQDSKPVSAAGDPV